jgi:hypothetical protein
MFKGLEVQVVVELLDLGLEQAQDLVEVQQGLVVVDSQIRLFGEEQVQEGQDQQLQHGVLLQLGLEHLELVRLQDLPRLHPLLSF